MCSCPEPSWAELGAPGLRESPDKAVSAAAVAKALGSAGFLSGHSVRISVQRPCILGSVPMEGTRDSRSAELCALRTKRVTLFPAAGGSALLALPGARSESWLRWSQHGARSPLAPLSEWNSNLLASWGSPEVYPLLWDSSWEPPGVDPLLGTCQWALPLCS